MKERGDTEVWAFPKKFDYSLKSTVIQKSWLAFIILFGFIFAITLSQMHLHGDGQLLVLQAQALQLSKLVQLFPQHSSWKLQVYCTCPQRHRFEVTRRYDEKRLI